MYLIILGEVEIYESLKEELYPIIRNACLYNRTQSLITRGMDFFKNNKCSNFIMQTQALLRLIRRPKLRILDANTSIFAYNVSMF